MNVDVTAICHVMSLLWALALGCKAQYTEDSCNWILWGEGEGPGGIRTVRPECGEGLVQWKHPYGAFRLVFTEPYAKSFETCFIAWTVNVTIKISEEASHGLEPLTLLNRNVYKGRGITAGNSDDSHDREICVKSKGRDAIVIFIEAVLDTRSGVGTFHLNYDTTTTIATYSGEVSTGKTIRDCRPCSHNEIVEAACYSDFIVRGEIDDVSHRPETGESFIQVSLDKVYRQVHSVFKRSIQVSTDNNTTRRAATDNVLHYKGLSDTTRKHQGHIVAPYDCGIAAGKGTFVFMGKVRLKRPHLLCAPRVEDFQKIWMGALRTRTNNCVIG